MPAERVSAGDAPRFVELGGTLIDPADLTKTRALPMQTLATAAEKAGGTAIAPDELNRALEELERGEIVRNASDIETGFTAYRLEHDYLTRGVLAAERRANRWHYLLEDCAKTWRNAGSFASRWKTSCRSRRNAAWHGSGCAARSATGRRLADHFMPGWHGELARIMHHTTLFCRSGELTRADGPSGGIGVRQLVVQRVRG
jgi:hypothetical protein